VAVENLDRSVAFYTEVLGCRLESTHHDLRRARIDPKSRAW